MTPLTQLLVFPGFDELDVVAPLEILRSAGFDLRLVTADGAEAVEGTHRVTLRVDGQLDLSLGGLVIVPGGGWVRQEGGVRLALAAGVIPPLLAQARAAGLLLGSICNGRWCCSARPASSRVDRWPRTPPRSTRSPATVPTCDATCASSTTATSSRAAG